MNPTGKNISSHKEWSGLKAPLVGTKNIWKLFVALGLFDKKLFRDIQNMKPSDWSYDFTERVYEEVRRNKMYLSNLSKATQEDARPQPNSVFREYVSLMKEEIKILNPKVVILFGNQVSSILLNEAVTVSKIRKQGFILPIGNREYNVYPVFYPVGMGMRNIHKSIEDIHWILKNN